MVRKAQSGDKTAKTLVDKYHYRPEFELYDCQTDPLEMKNLASDAQHADTIASLKGELDRWMKSQGDMGKETEIEAVLHQGRYKKMSRAEALEAYETRKTTKSKGKSAGKKSKKKAAK